MRLGLILRTVQILLLTGLVVVSARGVAAGDREHIEKTEAAILQVVELAREGQFEVLEEMAAKRRAYADAHPDEDVKFTDIFDPFRRADPDLAGSLAEWRKAYPNSFAPHMAFGAYSTHLGWVARGEGGSRQTHPNRFKEMRRYFDSAISSLRMGIRLYPKVPKAWTRLIGIAMAKGDTVEVEELFQEARPHVPNSSYLYRTYYDALAPKWVGSGAQQHALKFRIQGEFAGNPDFGWIETVEDHDQAWRSYWWDDLDAALDLFDKIIAVRPDYSSRYGRAVTLVDSNRIEDALNEYERVLALDPGNAKIYAQTASAQERRLETRDLAAGTLDRALLFDPYHPDYLQRRARIHLDFEETAAAKRLLDKALLLGAYDDDVRDKLRRYYWEIGEVEKAIDEAEKMITLNPTRMRNWLLFAITLKKGKDCRAVDAYERYKQLCLMDRRCDRKREEMATLEIYNMKKACS